MLVGKAATRRGASANGRNGALSDMREAVEGDFFLEMERSFLGNWKWTGVVCALCATVGCALPPSVALSGHVNSSSLPFVADITIFTYTECQMIGLQWSPSFPVFYVSC